MNLDKYRQLFVDEATEHLQQMSVALAVLGSTERAEERTEAIDTLFRMTHSIKGMAASLDYDPVSSLAHCLEDQLSPMRSTNALPEGGLPLIYEVVGALEMMVRQVEEAASPPSPREDLIQRLRQPWEAEEPSLTNDSLPAPRGEVTPPPLPRSVRVQAQAVDRFLASVGELVHHYTCLKALHRVSPYWDRHREFGEQLESMARVVRELGRGALDIRITAIRRIFERMPRVAAQLAERLGKKVRMELRGEEVEADRAVLDHLDDPLLHLVRNAIDHGIEPCREREAAGKDPAARIGLSASTAGGRLYVRVEDDGRGIDVEAVRRRAIDHGLLLEQVAEDLSPERICEFIFHPGISTREEVTTVSGRGVGLDAVKRTIEGLGGTVSVESRPGEGTTFQIELPSMVALQRVLVIEVDGERVAIPITSVEAVLELGEGTVERAGGDAFFVWKDEPIPLLDLAERLGLAAPPAGQPGNVVVFETRGFRLGLRVDRAAADLEVFVREVPRVLAPIEPLGGVAILPDGVPIFLLEVGVLMESFA